MRQKTTDMLAALAERLRHPRTTGRVPDDLDGACPSCDHPFGLARHMCLGTGTAIGQLILVSR